MLPVQTNVSSGAVGNRFTAEELLKFLDAAVQEVYLLTAGSSGQNTAKTLTKDEPAVKNLCKVLDQLFCLGLKLHPKQYWWVVKEVLSRDQVQVLERSWEPKSERAWSLAWLYQSLNDGTLEWQLICLQQNHHLLSKYYAKESLMLDAKATEKAVACIERLESVGFDIRPPDAPRLNIQENNGDRKSEKGAKLKREGRGGPMFSVSDCGKKIPIATASKEARLMETKVADLSAESSSEKLLITSESAGAVVEECQDALNFSFVSDEGNYAPLATARRVVFRKKKSSSADPKQSAHKKQSVSLVVSIKDEGLLDSGRFQGSDELSFDNAPLASTPKFRNEIEESCAYTSGLAFRDHDAVLKEILDEKRTSPEGIENPEPFQPESTSSAGEAENLIQVKIEKKIADTESLAEFREYWKEQEKIAKVKSEPQLMSRPDKGREWNMDFEKQIRERLVHVSSRLSTLSDHYDHARDQKELLDTMNRNSVELSSKEASPDHYEGEILLDSGEIIQLAMEVFTKEGEQFYKLFRVYLSHHTGTPLMRWLLLTNYAVYLLIRNSRRGRVEQDFDERDMESPPKEAMAVKIQKYHTDRVIPLSQLDYISVGLNSQFFNVLLKEKERSVTVCTGSELLTRSVLSSLELAVRRCGISGLQPPSVLTDATPHKIAVQKWASNELHKEPNACPVLLYTLIYWKHVAEEGSGGGIARSSYLYFREYYPMNWFKRSTDWRYNYFILQNRKLYHFEDSTCKVGLKIYDLRNDITGCREMPGIKEQRHCLELIFPDLESTVQLGCQTKHDLEQWLQAVICALSQADEGMVQDRLPCFLLITSGHILLGQESESLGFVRTMATLNLTDIGRIFVVRGDLQHTVVLLVDSGSGGTGLGTWVLSLRSPHEMDRVLRCLSEQTGLSPEDVSWEAAEDSFLDSDESSRVAELCMDLEDYWRICSQL